MFTAAYDFLNILTFQAWENLEEKVKNTKDVKLQMAHTMRHAGVAISVRKSFNLPIDSSVYS